MRHLSTPTFLALAVVFLTIGGCSSSDSSNGADSNQGNVDDNGNQQDGQLMSINTENFDQILLDVVATINLDAINEMRVSTGELSRELSTSSTGVLAGGPALDGLTLVTQTDFPAEPPSPAGSQLDFNCNAEGTFTDRVFDFNGAPASELDMTFNACALGSVRYNGQYQATRGRRADTLETFAGFSASEGAEESFLAGQWREAFPFFETDENVWTNAQFSSVGTGNDLQLQRFNWRRSGTNSSLADGSRRGFVTDTQGNVRPVVEFIYEAALVSSFSFSNASTGNLPVDVSVNLSFSANYWDWEASPQLDPVIPAFPVSDLGNPLIFSTTESFTDSVENVENIPQELNAQWQVGAVIVTAPDGSTVSLRPNINDNSTVIVELNETGFEQQRALSDGFAVICPSVIEGCGGDEFL